MSVAQIAIVLAVLLAINALAFWMFYWDKWCAENNHWRISEASLLLVALIGGSAGAITAQQTFRHKTRKEPFRSLLFAIAAVQAAVLVVLAVAPLRKAVVTALGGAYRSGCVERLIETGDVRHFLSCLGRA